MIITSIAFIFLFFYCTLLLRITIGWFRIPAFKNSGHVPGIKVSIVISARNEGSNMVSLLTDLSRQDYPSELMEIIVIDDHSEDSTRLLAKQFCIPGRTAPRVFSLSDKAVSGKKAALDCGISMAYGDLILITDADCRIPVSWVKTVADYYAKFRPALILSPVILEPVSGVFEIFQELEFMSLQATAAGSVNAGFPLMANGANLALSKETYISCGGFSGNMKYPSGDDMFILIAIKQKYGKEAIKYLKSDKVIIKTSPAKGWNDFINQRLRWVSKSKGYKDLPILISSLLVYITNLAFIILLVAGIFDSSMLLFSGVFYILKLIIDLPVMVGISRFHNCTKDIWLFPFLEIVNAFYIVIIGVLGNLRSFTWKGRQFSPIQ